MLRLALLTLFAPLAVACADDDRCVTETRCADDDDCGNGQRCNRALSKPSCAAIACASDGEPCSADALCESDSCWSDERGDNVCWSGPLPEGWPCYWTGGPDCEAGLMCNYASNRCIRPGSTPDGSACSADSQCAGGRCIVEDFCGEPFSEGVCSEPRGHGTLCCRDSDCQSNDCVSATPFADPRCVGP